MMTREECISELCKLTEEVASRCLGWGEATDCFCEQSKNRDPEYWRHTGRTIRFIQETVRRRLAQIEELRKVRAKCTR